MAKINRNVIAKELSEMEGLKDQMSIAQIKEIMRVYNEFLTLPELIKIWFAYEE